MLKIEVKEIEGDCPVYDEGDEIFIEDPEILLERTDRLCTHALATILHYSTALEKGVKPLELGLNKEDENVAYVQCVDPGESYTGGGTVVFRIDIT